MARFGQALTASKVPQQLSKASAPHNPPLALPSYLPIGLQTVSIGLRNCYVARFGQALKASKVPQQLSKASAPHNPPLALPSYLPIGPSNCFYWASKLLHGTFWPGLKTLKSLAAAFESLSTAQPSACFAIVPPHKPFKLFLLGFETATWHVLATKRIQRRPFGQCFQQTKIVYENDVVCKKRCCLYIDREAHTQAMHRDHLWKILEKKYNGMHMHAP